MKKMVSLALVICLVFISLWISPGYSEPEEVKEPLYESRGGARGTSYVGPGQTYSKIQDAINDSIPGDTIRVYAGIYHENVLVNKSIDLIGNGSANTIVNASYKGSGITITADWCKVSGFYVTASGTARNNSTGNNSAGITLLGVEYCNFTNNDN